MQSVGEIESEIENPLRRLLLGRAPESVSAKLFRRRRIRVLTERKELSTEEFFELWEKLTPERRAQVLKQAAKHRPSDEWRVASDEPGEITPRRLR